MRLLSFLFASGGLVDSHISVTCSASIGQLCNRSTSSRLFIQAFTAFHEATTVPCRHVDYLRLPQPIPLSPSFSKTVTVSHFSSLSYATSATTHNDTLQLYRYTRNAPSALHSHIPLQHPTLPQDIEQTKHEDFIATWRRPQAGWRLET